MAAVERGERYPNLRTLEYLVVTLNVRITIMPGVIVVDLLPID